MNGYQPRDGELVGVFVAAGNLRDKVDHGSGSYVLERSNVALVPFGGSYRSGAASVPSLSRLLSRPRR
jgi:hypothetical protein